MSVTDTVQPDVTGGEQVTLPGVDATAPPTAPKADGQWRLLRLQLVNWGGFEGAHSIEFADRATLMSGGSGSGKSTVLDAYIALMMDSNVPFNGASNDSGAGRARSAQQRNVLSYMRGLIDLAHDEQSGRTRELYLRGEGAATWSAVGATWKHDDGTRHTAMRIFYAPATAARPSDVTVHFAQIPGEFSLEALESFAEGRFHEGRMKAAWPQMEFRKSYAAWAAALHTRLGIGRGGDGSSAIRLLARIQAGRAIVSVDDLYKDMVLEQPRTYGQADKAIEHFAELRSSYEMMCTAQAQVECLTPAADLHATLTAAQTELDLIDTFGLMDGTGAGRSVLLWRLRLEKRLLEAEAAHAKTLRDAASTEHDQADAAVHELDQRLRDNRQQQRDNGGDALEQLGADVERLTGELAKVNVARAQFAPQAPGVELPVSAAELLGRQEEANAFLARYDEVAQAQRAQQEQLWREKVPLDQRAGELDREIAYLRGRRNLIPPEMDQARRAYADAAGLDESELPYVAELLDLHPEHESWREAAELLLGGFARTMLVDRAHSNFRRIIDPLRQRKRTNFRLVPTGVPHIRLDERYLPGRLVFAADSPFTGWLSGELSRAFDYLCAEQFPADGSRAILLSGQVQDGPRGAHGGHGSRPILGFSTVQLLQTLTAELAALQRELDAFTPRQDALDTQRRAHERRRDVSRYLLSLTWPQLDVDGATDRLAEAQRKQADLLAASDLLAALREEEGQLVIQLDTQRDRRVRAGDKFAEQDRCWGNLVEVEDEVGRLRDSLEDDGVTVSAEQAARLDEEYAKFSRTGSSDELADVFARMRKALLERSRNVREKVKMSSDALRLIFTEFQRQWSQPNLGVETDSFAGYQEILTELNADGLATRRAEFTRRVVDWSSEDLLGLAGAYEEAIDEIDSRLMPINEVLAQLPFGPRGDRLHISMRQMRSADITGFRQALVRLASSSTRIEAEQVDERFAELEAFMRRIDPITGSRERDQLLDVRRHVHVQAERLDAATGEKLSLYDGLGSKSGGETQELVAFIVGAALRYQLGIGDATVPAYAPVLLDEAFIKADSEFAGRAVRAWQGLGFQLVIGAPLDKVPAIDPYVDRMLEVWKADHYSAHAGLDAAEYRARRKAEANAAPTAAATAAGQAPGHANGHAAGPGNGAHRAQALITANGHGGLVPGQAVAPAQVLAGAAPAPTADSPGS